jgi:hypothetical protein
LDGYGQLMEREEAMTKAEHLRRSNLVTGLLMLVIGVTLLLLASSLDRRPDPIILSPPEAVMNE